MGGKSSSAGLSLFARNNYRARGLQVLNRMRCRGVVLNNAGLAVGPESTTLIFDEVAEACSNKEQVDHRAQRQAYLLISDVDVLHSRSLLPKVDLEADGVDLVAFDSIVYDQDVSRNFFPLGTKVPLLGAIIRRGKILRAYSEIPDSFSWTNYLFKSTWKRIVELASFGRAGTDGLVRARNTLIFLGFAAEAFWAVMQPYLTVSQVLWLGGGGVVGALALYGTSRLVFPLMAKRQLSKIVDLHFGNGNGGSMDEQMVYQVAAGVAEQLLGVTSVSVIDRPNGNQTGGQDSNGNGEGRIAAAVGRAATRIGEEVTLSKTTTRVFEGGESVLVRGAPPRGAFNRWLGWASLRNTYVQAPIFINGEVVAVLSASDSRCGFGQAEQLMVDEIASYAGSVLANFSEMGVADG